MKTLPMVFHERLTPKYEFRRIKSADDFVESERVINVFHKDRFNSRNYHRSVKRKGAYCTHRFAGSWLTKQDKRLDWNKILPDAVSNFAHGFVYLCLCRKELKTKQIPYHRTRHP